MENNLIEAKKVPIWPLMLLFFTSTDTVLFGTNDNNLFLYVPRIVGLFLLVALPFIFRKGQIILNKQTVVMAVLVSIIAISGIVNDAEMTTVLSRIIAVLAAYAVATNYCHDDYIRAFDKFMYIVAISALITEAIAYILPSLLRMLPVIVNTAGKQFRIFFIGSMRIDFLEKPLIRAGGVFWEPGAFAIYLNVAIMYQMFFNQKTSVTKLLVYIVALIFTFSTTGYIAFLFMMVVYVVCKKSKTDKQKVQKVLLIILILLLLFAMVFGSSSYVYNVVFGKIENTESTTVTRYSSIVHGMQIAFDHPFFGVSSNKIGDLIYEYSQNSEYDIGTNKMLTNTFVCQCASYGLIFGAIFLIFTCKYFLGVKGNFLCKIGLVITLFLLYVGESFLSYFPYVFVFYGISGLQSRSANENTCN